MSEQKKQRDKRKPNTFEVFFPIAFMMVILFIGRVILGIDMTVLLFTSAAVTAILAFKLGYTWDDMLAGVVRKMTNSVGALFLLIIVGAMIGSMIACGSVPMLIYYGIHIISAKWLIATSFVLCCIVSVITGTSWGSVATIGVTVMGIALAQGVNPAAVAGAVIGGSWFGDKLSPISDTTNLTAASTGTDLFDHVRQMLWTTIPAAIIALIAYIIVGMSTNTQTDYSSELLTGMISQLDSLFNWNILLLLPIVLILLASILKFPSIPSMFAATCVAILEAIFIQGISVGDIFKAVSSGFKTSMIAPETMEVMPEISSLLERGGMNSMMGTVLLIMGALSFAGILDCAGCLEGMLERISKIVNSDRKLMLSTVFTCLGICFITNNYVSSVVLGEMYQGLYTKRGLHTANLSRTLEDCGTCIIPLVPWSASGAYVITMLGVATATFFPWAIFCWVSPIISIFYAITGISIKRLNRDEINKLNAEAQV